MRIWFGTFVVIAGLLVFFGSPSEAESLAIHGIAQAIRRQVPAAAQAPAQPKLPPGALSQTTPIDGDCNLTDGSFSAKGNEFVSVHKNGAVRHWDPVTGKSIKGPFESKADAEYKGTGNSSRDGRFQVRHEEDGKGFDLKDRTTGKVKLIPENNPDLASAHFSPDGKKLAVFTNRFNDQQGPTILMWDTATGEQLLPADRPKNDSIGGYTGGGSPLIDFVFNANAKRMAVSSSGGVTVWDLSKRAPLYQFPSKDIGRGLALSADGTRIAFFNDKSIEVHKIPGGRVLAKFPAAEKPAVEFSPDGRSLVIASDEKIKAYEIDSLAELWTLDAGRPVHGVHRIVFSPKGDRMASFHLCQATFWSVPHEIPKALPKDTAGLVKLLSGSAPAAQGAIRAAAEQPKLDHKALAKVVLDNLPKSPEKAHKGTVDEWVKNLDANDFKVREKTNKAARDFAAKFKNDTNVGRWLHHYLRTALTREKITLELRRRIESLLESTEFEEMRRKSELPPTGDLLTSVRVIALLEASARAEGAPRAAIIAQLRSIADTLPYTRESQAAREALLRLQLLE